MNPPAALFVTTVASTLEAFLLPLADALQADGWRVDALANGASQRSALASHFGALYDADWSRRLTDPGNFLESPSRVRHIVAEGAYDIVHAHTPIAGFVTRYALRAESGPAAPRVIYTAHGFHFFEGGSAPGNTAYREAERTAARWTDYLVTMNREDYEAAVRFGTIPPDRIRHIPGVGVDADRYAASAPAGQAVRAELGLSPETFVVVMIAEMNANKHHDLVLKAFARMRERRAALLLVGVGPLQRVLEARVEALGLGGRVRFLGQRDDVPALLAAGDALVIASEREGMPRSVLEAMAAGVPVVGTRTRGVVDAVDDAAGWLVASREPAALADALDFAAAHPDEATARGSTGQELVAQRYSEAAIVRAYVDLYHEALAQSHR